MLQATFKTTFTHKGSERHAYTVDGTPEELADYKAKVGEFYAEDRDNGKPLYYTNFRSIQDSAPLKYNEESGYYNLQERELQNAISKVNSIGGAVGQAMANQLATALMPDSVKKIINSAQGAQMELPLEPKAEQSADSDDPSNF